MMSRGNKPRIPVVCTSWDDCLYCDNFGELFYFSASIVQTYECNGGIKMTYCVGFYKTNACIFKTSAVGIQPWQTFGVDRTVRMVIPIIILFLKRFLFC